MAPEQQSFIAQTTTPALPPPPLRNAGAMLPAGKAVDEAVEEGRLVVPGHINLFAEEEQAINSSSRQFLISQHTNTHTHKTCCTHMDPPHLTPHDDNDAYDDGGEDSDNDDI